MEVKFEIKFTIDGKVIERELTLKNSDKEAIKAALVAAVSKYRQNLLPLVMNAIDEA